MTILMGRSPGGLNATGDAEIRIYYDGIADSQDADMLDPLNRLMNLAMLAKEGPTGGIVEEDWFIEFNPLWQPTEAETVETRNKQADTDVNYISSGVVTPEEIAISRFGGEEYSIETEIDEETDRLIPGENKPENKNDASHPSKRLRRKQLIKEKFRLRRDRFFDNPDMIEGTTGVEKEHDHEYIIFNTETGEGWTDSAGKDNHTHRIEGGTVQPFESADGTTHMHTIPKVK